MRCLQGLQDLQHVSFSAFFTQYKKYALRVHTPTPPPVHFGQATATEPFVRISWNFVKKSLTKCCSASINCVEMGLKCQVLRAQMALLPTYRIYGPLSFKFGIDFHIIVSKGDAFRKTWCSERHT